MSKNLSFDESTNVLTVSDVEGVDYTIGGKVVTGEVELTKDTVVVARPHPGRTFPQGAQTRFEFKVSGSPASAESDAPAAADPVETRVSGSSAASRFGGTTPNPGPTGSEGTTGGTP